MLADGKGGPHIPPYLVAVILCRQVDIPALARLLPLVLDEGYASPASETYATSEGSSPSWPTSKPGSITFVRARLEALGQYIQRCTELKGYVFLRPALEAALPALSRLDAHDSVVARRQKKGAEGKPDPEVAASIAASKMLARYQRLLTCLVNPEWTELVRPRMKGAPNEFHLGTDLSRPVRDGVERIVLHTLSQLEQMGPGATLACYESALRAFLGPFLTFDTLRPIMYHVKQHGIDLPERDWRHAAHVAIHEGTTGDEHMMRRGRAYLAEAARTYAADRAAADEPDPEAERETEDGYRLMAASAAPSFREVFETLHPLVARSQRQIESERDPGTWSAAVFSGRPNPPHLTEGRAAEVSNSQSSNPQSPLLPTPPTIRPRNTLMPDITLASLWRVLISRAAEDKAVSDDDLMGLITNVPERAVCAETLTAAMQGLLLRQDPRAAARIWAAARERHAYARGLARARMMDATLLTVAARAKASVAKTEGRNPVNAAIKVVDQLAVRPNESKRIENKNTAHTVSVDTRALNALLRICLKESVPSVAFRLFRVAESRWAVIPNEVSLALVLDTARHHTGQEEDTLEARVQMMKDTFSLRNWRRNVLPRSDASPYSVDRALLHESRALYDPPGYTWRAEYGSQRPVDVARSLFETIIFSNWPGLKATPSPLKHGGALTELRALISPNHIAGEPPSPLPYTVPPLDAASYAHLVPDAAAWDAYIKIIAYHFPDEDLPLRLAYMRALGVVPLWRTMLIALKMVGEREGPRMRITTKKGTSMMRDEHAVRAYLEEWLGEEDAGSPTTRKVPSEEDVAAFWKDQEIQRALFVQQRIIDERGGD
jgi:hypothetical protein